jgi:hypothetical protein
LIHEVESEIDGNAQSGDSPFQLYRQAGGEGYRDAMNVHAMNVLKL